MIVAVCQTVLTGIACYALWRLARRSTSRITAAGFLLRAFAAQALFWISWLRLPIASSLQIGEGLWFFSLDGAFYYRAANELVLTGSSAAASIPVVQFFAYWMLAFGNVVSAAILLNCFAYLGTALLIEDLGGRSSYTKIALVALALNPSNILWSTQPLKDSLFCFLLAALVKLLDHWQLSWRRERAIDWRRFFAWTAAMIAVLFAIAATRAYMAVFICALFVPFVVMVAARGRRWDAAILGVLLLLPLTQVTRLGGGEELRRVQRRIARPEHARMNFDQTGGGTHIIAGPLLAQGGRARSFAAGLAATFLPRTVAQPAGLVRIGGGRGLWFFADIDTLVFDAMIVIAIAWCIRRLRAGASLSPAFVFFLLLLLITAGPLIYSVTNFGTLFRLRQLIYVLAVLLPMTLAESSNPLGTQPGDERVPAGDQHGREARE